MGLKLFYFYHDHSLYASSFQEILKKKDVKVIHLIRKDILKLYVSLKVAQKTNRWSSIKPRANKVEKLHIDLEDFQQFATTYLQRQQYFKNLFKHHSMIMISYEDLTNLHKDVLKEVQQFLNVKSKKLLSLLKKQNPESLASLVINLTEAKAILARVIEDG